MSGLSEADSKSAKNCDSHVKPKWGCINVMFVYLTAKLLFNVSKSQSVFTFHHLLATENISKPDLMGLNWILPSILINFILWGDSIFLHKRYWFQWDSAKLWSVWFTWLNINRWCDSTEKPLPQSHRHSVVLWFLTWNTKQGLQVRWKAWHSLCLPSLRPQTSASLAEQIRNCVQSGGCGHRERGK